MFLGSPNGSFKLLFLSTPAAVHYLGTTTPKVLLEHCLKMLRLPTFLREYDKVAQQCSDESVDIRAKQNEGSSGGVAQSASGRFAESSFQE